MAAVNRTTTLVTNLGPARRITYYPPNGRDFGSGESVEMSGLLEVDLHLAQRTADLAKMLKEQQDGLVDVLYNINSSVLNINTLSTLNVAMAALVTVANGSLATLAPILGGVVTGGLVQPLLNGVALQVADSNAHKTLFPCYFSADGGTTAKALGHVTVGDHLYWNGSVAGYQLAVSDLITFLYIS